MPKIRITAGAVTVDAQLDDSPTAEAIWQALPITAQANRWGQEIYFPIQVCERQEGDARADVAVGELGYWPPGNAFCIFFGRTPVSFDDQPRAASPVNPIGRVIGDATVFDQVSDGETVTVQKA